ncbi:MAG: hypothetical protein ACLUNR_02340, partial [Bacilli bacterium]
FLTFKNFMEYLDFRDFLAEAEAMQKKAEAYSKYGSIAVIDMLSKLNEKVLPDMADIMKANTIDANFSNF